jgi:hypothetical protein
MALSWARSGAEFRDIQTQRFDVWRSRRINGLDPRTIPGQDFQSWLSSILQTSLQDTVRALKIYDGMTLILNANYLLHLVRKAQCDIDNYQIHFLDEKRQTRVMMPSGYCLEYLVHLGRVP